MAATRTQLDFTYDRKADGTRRIVLYDDSAVEYRIYFGTLDELGILLAQFPLDWQRSARILAQVRQCMADDERDDSEDFAGCDLNDNAQVTERDGAPSQHFIEPSRPAPWVELLCFGLVIGWLLVIAKMMGVW